jgi:hypothetical protein
MTNNADGEAYIIRYRRLKVLKTGSEHSEDQFSYCASIGDVTEKLKLNMNADCISVELYKKLPTPVVTVSVELGGE